LNYKRILIFRNGHLGDSLVSLPALWGIRRTFPDAEITLLTNGTIRGTGFPGAPDVFPSQGLYDNLLIYPNQPSRLRAVPAISKLFLQLKRGKYDVLFYLMNRNRRLPRIERDIAFFRRAGIDRVVGAEHLKQNLLDPSDGRPITAVEAETDFFVDCLTSEGIRLKGGPFEPELMLTERERAAAESTLAATGLLDSSRPLIGIAPGSNWPSKVWPVERFIEVVRSLIASHDIIPVIVGSAKDRSTGYALIKEIGEGLNTCGDLTVRESAALLERCALYLGNDTGSMHLAAAVGTRCVAVFAAIDFPGRWRPFGSTHTILRRSVECEGCHTPDCFNNHKCLDLIRSDEVHEACISALREGTVR
jgi:ADP-heptose:LPS heptosyltransferase